VEARVEVGAGGSAAANAVRNARHYIIASMPRSEVEFCQRAGLTCTRRTVRASNCRASAVGYSALLRMNEFAQPQDSTAQLTTHLDKSQLTTRQDTRR
jgi:predicted transglutaminase-like cysteine proteinase